MVLVDLIVVEHFAKDLSLVLKERHLLGAQRDLVFVHDILQRRISSEQISVKSHSSRIQCSPLRLGNLGHNALCQVICRHDEIASRNLVLRSALNKGAASLQSNVFNKRLASFTRETVTLPEKRETSALFGL